MLAVVRGSSIPLAYRQRASLTSSMLSTLPRVPPMPPVEVHARSTAVVVVSLAVYESPAWVDSLLTNLFLYAEERIGESRKTALSDQKRSLAIYESSQKWLHPTAPRRAHVSSST